MADPPRRFDGGNGSFTREQFIAHYDGVDEWNAASPLQQNENEWYYTDLTNTSELHGPFTLGKLERWLNTGHFEAMQLVRKGRKGKDVELGPVIEATQAWFYVDTVDATVRHARAVHAHKAPAVVGERTP
tara:strand:+ start:139 stop:528 length:390 start_codon:yes stop_codon:yes gene_type:complete